MIHDYVIHIQVQTLYVEEKLLHDLFHFTLRPSLSIRQVLQTKNSAHQLRIIKLSLRQLSLFFPLSAAGI